MLITVYITVADYWKLKREIILKFYTNPYRYERYFENFIIPEIGMMRVSEVTVAEFERIVKNIFSAGKSKSVVSMVSALFRKFIHQAAIDKLTNEEKFKNMKPITFDADERRVFSIEQETSLLLTFQLTGQPELYTLAMFTGIPYLDLANCVIDDYSKDNKTLRVVRQAYQYFAKSRNATPVERLIPLSDNSCKILDRAIIKRHEKNKRFPGHESNFIFTNEENEHFHRIAKYEYYKIRKKSGIPDFNMKDLVSNFGVHALKYKVNPNVLKHYIGYKGDRALTLLSVACHNNSKDIQASDDFYRRLKDE